MEKRINYLLSAIAGRFNQCSDEEKWKINRLAEEENKFFQLACLKAGISVQRDIKISVIVPIYNVEEYIRECLDSIVNQTLKDIEIILVDDCSTDNSGRISDEYYAKDGRIIVIHKEKNEGALLARKTGVAHAQGRYIVFVDADDYLTSDNSLKTIYNIIEEKNVDIVQFNVGFSNEIDELRKDIFKFLKNENLIVYGAKDIISECFLKRKYSWTLWNKIYNANICKKGCKYIEDIYLNNGTDIYTFFVLRLLRIHFKLLSCL